MLDKDGRHITLTQECCRKFINDLCNIPKIDLRGLFTSDIYGLVNMSKYNRTTFPYLYSTCFYIFYIEYDLIVHFILKLRITLDTAY